MEREQARRPFHVLVKPAGPRCNHRCEYCFYQGKAALYPDEKLFRMTGEVLEDFTRQYIRGQPDGSKELQFAWQGGEPTLMGLDFFRHAVELQRRYARPGLRITNALQTNGSLLDEEWGRFLAAERFLIGISIDGPEELHDRYRVDGQGRGTFRAVMRGLDVLRRHRVEFNTLTVVNRENGGHPVEVYDFLKSIGSRFMQFIPNVMFTREGKPTPQSVAPKQFGSFLSRVFDRWIEHDVGRVFVQHFDVTLGLVTGGPASLCVHAETCGQALALEYNGDLYSCDHFVYAGNKLGNISEAGLAEMAGSRQQADFGRNKKDALPEQCRACRYLSLCRGGCPAQRVSNRGGQANLNYLCAGYRYFYTHSLPYITAMADCLRAQRPARDFRRLVPRGENLMTKAHTGRNDPCPCGSGSKFKRCCGCLTEMEG